MHFIVPQPDEEPPTQAPRTERVEESPEEKSMKARLHGSWPQLSISNDREGPSVTEGDLRMMLNDHDRAHEHCLNERWTVRSRFGAHNRFGLSATFTSVAVVSDVNPPDARSHLTHAYAVNWSITDHETNAFYRFNASDVRSPELLSMLIAKKTVRDQPSMMQALLEQLNGDRMVLPDQRLSDAASTRLTELDVQYGPNTLRGISRPRDRRGQPKPSTYALHLEGVSHDHEGDDAAQEVRAIVDLTFEPRSIPPVMDGVRGIFSDGNWEDDEFHYCLLHTRCMGGAIRLTRASDDLELVRDSDAKRALVWMEHSFGGVVPRSEKEAQMMRTLRHQRIERDTEVRVIDRCVLRLFDEGSHSLTVTRVMVASTKEVKSCIATVQSAVSRKAHQYVRDVELTDVMTSSYRSSETGIVYPFKWKLRCPMPGGVRLELEVTATLPHQEITTALAEPSVWDGTVKVSGLVHKPAGGVTEVLGDGYVTSRGRGKMQAEKKLFAMLRGIGTSAMEKKEVAVFASWEDIAAGPAVDALAGLKVALTMLEMELTQAQQVLLTALFGTYGYIFHHPTAETQVKLALEWCYNKWLTFFGVQPIGYRTLTLRAFMMQELNYIMHEKCKAWVPKAADALDIAVPVNYIANSNVADSGSLPFPARALLSQPPSALEISQIKALMDGTWIMDPDQTEGSMNAVLIEQGVGVLWRSVNNNAVPTWIINVNAAPDKLLIEEVTMLERRSFKIALDGKAWEWDSVSRGRVTSRSYVFTEGPVLYVETEVQEGVERVWYKFQKDAKTMVQHIFYYRNSTDPQPVASCERHFKIQLPLGSPMRVH